MVASVSPDYYAAGQSVGDYTVEGSGFDLIPSTAIGVCTDDVNQPLKYKDTEQESLLYDIVQKTDTEMLLSQRVTASHALQNYLGCIVSADRQTIYWERPV